MSAIEKLRMDEPVRLDPDRLVVIYAELGELGAERLIAAAMEDLAVHLVAAQLAAQEGRAELLERAAREMAKLAGQVGMVMLTRVAEDLLLCVERKDKISQAAVLARLVRIAERSLTAVWDLQDMRI
ncbi:hypothetical protein C8J27_102410 [Rhodobacter aestuarii]|uniref:Uncharacterized protein n=1 Tax=Rhodobacter aestuarii TaxID=453582 RepID=A0A1N7MQT7_9RHOB|nr:MULTISPECIES: hypothetical protein [Rhodobacter]PTV96608.1 hypothetical protein C8J27_102410 [Rhodobacter aestuarii]SIS88311.1 hypothetical protein SAMN05421580_106111 [Rhodobacter aestuarii]SOB91254.1 hypothetical protein SAMN05877809_101322 [Rhodobacter sp. JA431]